MPYLYLISSVFFMSSSSVFGAFYNRKSAGKKDAPALYSFIYLFTVFLGWAVLFAITPSFEWKVLPYSLAFGAFYTVCQIGNINALKTGPTVLTSLMLQLSLIAVTAWGFFFWDSEFTWLVGVGLILVALALWLCLYTGKKKVGEDKKISLKWFLLALMALVGNAGCSIVQKTQQMKFDGEHGNMLMLFATGISTAFCLINYLRSDKTDGKAILKASAPFPIVAGVCNVLLNLFVMLLATSTISPSLIYPVLAVGGLSITSVFSALVFRDKLAWWQWLGIAVGALAVILLSI